MYNPRPLSPVVTSQLKQLRLQLDALRKEVSAIDKNLALMSASLDAASGATTSTAPLRSALGVTFAPALTPLDPQLHQLLETMQMESRRFQTLANAAKARHDIAMNSINNTR
jgi:hypothetical protein